MTAEGWLREHAAGAPEALIAEMTRALTATPARVPAAVPVALADAALALYAAVAEGEGGREAALPLLAADALFTHAFEAQAHLDPRGLGELAARYGARGRLGEVAG